jgi:uncharacterized protein (DUF302 family)
MEKAGLVSAHSRYDPTETERRLRAALSQAGLSLFAEIDHSQNAADAYLSLRPTRLLLFGHARGGTPLMALSQCVGIDLPLKALIWVDEEGQTWVTCNDPQWLADRHSLGPAAETPVKALSAGTARLLAAATA